MTVINDFKQFEYNYYNILKQKTTDDYQISNEDNNLKYSYLIVQKYFSKVFTKILFQVFQYILKIK